MNSWPRNSWPPGALLLAIFAAAACTPLPTQDRAPRSPPDVSGVPDAVPVHEKRSRYGNPPHYEVFGKRYYVMDSAHGYFERGVASWYGEKFHGRRTSSGEPYDMYSMTAAHKSLPLPTYVRVTNLKNGREVVVKVNDRGPFVHNRIIDLSYTAAARLGIIEHGTGLVSVEALTGSTPSRLVAMTPSPPEPATGVPDGLSEAAVDSETPAIPVQTEDTGTAPGEIFVQLGAFADPLNARQLSDRLLALGFATVRISADPVGERMVYRVRIGPLAGVPQFDATVAQLEQAGYGDLHLAYE